jgi:3-oxoacyl-[acyl-carrier protein] reductase
MSSPVRVAAITGASKGIGQALTADFLARGYVVHGCSRSPHSNQPEGYHHAELDVADEAQVTRWMRSIKSATGRLDVLVCNAAYAPATQLMAMTPGSMFEEVMRTNAFGTYFACREAAKVMMRQRYGRIITVSSMAASLHLEGTSAYASSKSAIVEMTKVLARELAGAGITCNVLSISMYMTEAVDALGETVIARALDRLTIKRPLTTEEICHVVRFFSAPEAGAVTGQVVQLGLVT